MRIKGLLGNSTNFGTTYSRIRKASVCSIFVATRNQARKMITMMQFAADYTINQLYVVVVEVINEEESKNILF